MTRRRKRVAAALAFAGWAAWAAPMGAQEALVTYRSLALEVALELAQGTLAACRAQGYQVAVAVVDRSGNAQVVLRDRFAGPHTPSTAIGKAWTAVSFRTPTSALVELTRPGMPQSGVRDLPNVVVIGGGLPIEAAGSIVGGVGVSGAPGGEADEGCARAGIEKVRDRIEF